MSNEFGLIAGDKVKIWNRQKDHAAPEFVGVGILVNYAGKTRPGLHKGDPSEEQWSVKMVDGHKETRWISTLDLFEEPKTYSEAVSIKVTPPVSIPALSTPVKQAYDKALLRRAATILSDCVRCPTTLSLQESLDEWALPNEKAEVYAILLEFVLALEKEYNIEPSTWEMGEEAEEIFEENED